MDTINRFAPLEDACLQALDDLEGIGQSAPSCSVRAAAVRQLHEALADVVVSIHRWELFESTAREIEARQAKTA